MRRTATGKAERDDMFPVSPPALRDCWILAAPDAGVEILERPAGHIRVRRPVDRFEFGGDRLAVLPSGEIHGIADEMDDAGLHDRRRKDGSDRLGKSLQAID